MIDEEVIKNLFLDIYNFIYIFKIIYLIFRDTQN